MFVLFDFDLPGAVTEQLESKLAAMPSSSLTDEALRRLAEFQQEQGILQGVYQLLLDREAVYVGKATSSVQERLRQHLNKLEGRLNVNLQQVRFRCLLLHRNWSASANENLLVGHYKAKGECRWNSSGFGAKDVGKERDGTEPNRFDREYPINPDYPVSGLSELVSAGDLLMALKGQLPFTFRYEGGSADLTKPVDLSGVPRQARPLIARAVRDLGGEWQATLFPSHIILYPSRRSYPHGEVIAAG